MLKLGHIVYSNCFPVHAAIVTGEMPAPFSIVRGVPTELNRMLADGAVDVSPSSSIEYAVNAGSYLILPDLSITAPGRVMSITLESHVPIDELNRKAVALTASSATSVVLLRILLEIWRDVGPAFTVFDQEREVPSADVDAMLTIGDQALRRQLRSDYPYVYDLGALWHEFTGLPFVFALWQVNYKKHIDKDLAVLYDILLESKRRGLSRLPELAAAHGAEFGLPADVLVEYWRAIRYDFGPREQQGLLAYYGYAAELGIIGRVPELRFWKRGQQIDVVSPRTQSSRS